MNAIWQMAKKELMDGLRNRWLIAITLIFALLSSGMAWFGAAASGMVGFTSIPNTVISLASLGVFLIPLIALLLAYGAIVGEDEDGTLLLLLTYPLNKRQLLLGKLFGHSLILSIATLLGFGSSALTIALFAENIDIVNLTTAFSIFMLSALLLGMVFIALAYWISAWVAEKSKAAGLALITWFMFVLVFDLSLLGLLVVTDGQFHPEIFPYLLLLNPTDIFRLINLIGFEASGNGILMVASDAQFSLSGLFAALCAWVALPLSLAYWRLTKRPI